MDTTTIFTRLFKIDHILTSEQEHQAFLKCDKEVQIEAFTFLTTIRYVEMPGEKATTIAFMTEYEMDTFKKISEKTGIEYIITDITAEAILDKLPKEITDDSMVINNIVEPFLKLVLTVDIVLDKININGYDKLTKLDFNILKAN